MKQMASKATQRSWRLFLGNTKAQEPPRLFGANTQQLSDNVVTIKPQDKTLAYLMVTSAMIHQNRKASDIDLGVIMFEAEIVAILSARYLGYLMWWLWLRSSMVDEVSNYSHNLASNSQACSVLSSMRKGKNTSALDTPYSFFDVLFVFVSMI